MKKKIVVQICAIICIGAALKCLWELAGLTLTIIGMIVALSGYAWRKHENLKEWRKQKNEKE